jgi:hypothetical protein
MILWWDATATNYSKEPQLVLNAIGLYSLQYLYTSFQFPLNGDIILANGKTKLHGLGLRANYTDRATAACRRSDCQLLQIEGSTWSAWRIPMAGF